MSEVCAAPLGLLWVGSQGKVRGRDGPLTRRWDALASVCASALDVLGRTDAELGRPPLRRMVIRTRTMDLIAVRAGRRGVVVAPVRWDPLENRMTGASARPPPARWDTPPRDVPSSRERPAQAPSSPPPDLEKADGPLPFVAEASIPEDLPPMAALEGSDAETAAIPLTRADDPFWVPEERCLACGQSVLPLPHVHVCPILMDLERRIQEMEPGRAPQGGELPSPPFPESVDYEELH